MRICGWVCLLFLLGSTFGCDQEAMIKSMMPAEDGAIAKTYIGYLREHKFDLIEKDLDDSLKTPNIREMLTKMSSIIPAGEPISVKVVGFQGSSSASFVNGKSSSGNNITFEYQFPEKRKNS